MGQMGVGQVDVMDAGQRGRQLAKGVGGYLNLVAVWPARGTHPPPLPTLPSLTTTNTGHHSNHIHHQHNHHH